MSPAATDFICVCWDRLNSHFESQIGVRSLLYSKGGSGPTHRRRWFLGWISAPSVAGICPQNDNIGSMSCQSASAHRRAGHWSPTVVFKLHHGGYSLFVKAGLRSLRSVIRLTTLFKVRSCGRSFLPELSCTRAMQPLRRRILRNSLRRHVCSSWERLFQNRATRKHCQARYRGSLLSIRRFW